MTAAAAKPAVRDRAAWTYVSGLTTALESSLLSHRATLDLLAAERLDELLSRVRQTLLFDGLPDTAEPFELAESMLGAYADGIRRIADASPTRALADLFLLPIEWQAFRACLRSRVVGRERVATAGAVVPEAVWERCWASPDVGPPHDLFAAAAQSIREKMPREKRDERLVDEITEVFQTRHIARTARRVRSRHVAEAMTTWLKLRLAMQLLRCEAHGWGHIRYADALDDFGVDKQDIVALATPERLDWRRALTRLGLPNADEVVEDSPARETVLERLIDDHMTERARAGRGVPFGPEPVAGFLWGLRIEALNLRLVATGAAAGLPREAIASDIRRTYV